MWREFSLSKELMGGVANDKENWSQIVVKRKQRQRPVSARGSIIADI